MNYDRLFEPGQIGSCQTKNRIIMAPMGNINMADPMGKPSTKMIDYFVERARGGSGLLITGLVPVSFGIDPVISEEANASIFPRIDGNSRPRFAGWRDLAASVKPYNTRLFIQLTAGLGRVGPPEAMLRGKVLKSASINRNFYVPQLPHFPLSDRAIKKMVKNFGQAALNAKVCGIDGVHLHGHEGYMMDQLTSKPWNRRILGRYRNLFQFSLDVVQEIKNRCGKDFPIIYRMDLTQGLEESYGEEVFKKRFKGMERTVAEGLEFCLELVEAGVDAFDVDKGCYDNWFVAHPPAYADDIPYVQDMAGTLKTHLQNKGKSVPVIAVGKLGKPEQAARVLENEWADYVMLGRPLLADPYWPQKVREHRTKEITHCIGDQEACIQSFLLGGHPCCAVNPYTGFEDSRKLQSAIQKKRVAVVGAGPGGCEAARTAWARGHAVTLFEKKSRVGGQIIAGSQMRIKHDLARYLENLQTQIDLLQDEGLQVHYNTDVDPADLQGKFDVIICATGLKPQIPNIPGIETMSHIEVRDLLQNGLQVPAGVQKVTVLGGGLVGCEVAYSLAYELDLEVSVVEMKPDLMTGVVHANRAMMMWLMMGQGSPSYKPYDTLKIPVKAFNASCIEQIGNGCLTLSCHRQRPDPYTPWLTLIPENVHNPFTKRLVPNQAESIKIACDLLVLATGGTGNNALYDSLMHSAAAPEIYCVGDCLHPGRVWESVNSANEIARFI